MLILSRMKIFLAILVLFILCSGFVIGQAEVNSRYNHYFFLLDTSGTMKEKAPGAQIRTFEKLQVALNELIPSLPINTRVSIYTFDEGIQKQKHFQFPDDRKNMINFVNSLEFEGHKTWAWQSLEYVIEEAKKKYVTNSDIVPIIMMFTDGKDETSDTLESVLGKFQILNDVSNDSQLYIITLNFDLETPETGLPDGVIIDSVPPSKPIITPISVRFDWWPLSPKIGEQVKFINRTSPQKDTYSYNWNFGDGTESVEIEPVKTFAEPGSYKVSLAVVESTISTSYSKNIEVGVDISPIFSVSSRIGRAPLKIKIKNQSTGNITDYFWDFGDSQKSNDKDPLPHEYQQEGKYKISLTVKNNNTGESRILNMTVIVESPFSWKYVYIIGGGILFLLLAIASIIFYRKLTVPLLPRYNLDEILTKKSDHIEMGFGRKCHRRKNYIVLPKDLVDFPMRIVAAFEKSDVEWENAVNLSPAEGQCHIDAVAGNEIQYVSEGRVFPVSDQAGKDCAENAIIKVNGQPFILKSDKEDSTEWKLYPGWIVSFKPGSSVKYKKGQEQIDSSDRINLLPGDTIIIESISFQVTVDQKNGDFVLNANIERDEDSSMENI